MTTPNQPNDERHQTNGVTERIAPSPIPPRPIPRPVASAENGQPGGPPGGAQPHEMRSQQGDLAFSAPEPAGADKPESFDQTTARRNNADPSKDGGESAGGNGQSPFQEGWSQLPQREPQSNLYRPGQAPVTGRPTSGPGLGGGGGGGGLGSAGLGNAGLGNAGLGGGGLGGGAKNARSTADLAAKAARKEAAMVKSVGIDGPTRSIARPELIKDMPDLSEIRHPLPVEAIGPQTVAVSPAAPVAVAAAVASGEPLRATVQIRRIDPWSTLKISLVISVAMFFVWMLAVGLLYIVLEGMGVWERLNSTFTDMVSSDSGSVGLVDAGSVFGYAGVIGLINVVLFTALATVGVFIYNQCCDLVGGIQITLADPD
ncbi:DUF3566 domain-containing protein [Nocardia sp. NBC_00565]|uniref:DUF3566 domain-containing protein n=1 Tax=Nocardia sp. NBC_00565 TaxID=2975993 RepID=UPI002E8158E7|nr:DUF3566 domain-containing protein [Nocardia sp. NBC_00565]WUC02091.1 DUF3566 domain-containing protein [Nocardia sp. NBC_00565]